MHPSRARISSLDRLPDGSAGPARFAAPFNGALHSIRRPTQLFLQSTSSVYWDAPDRPGIDMSPPFLTSYLLRKPTTAEGDKRRAVVVELAVGDA